jgi:probable HAF family extracellular repeat protein
LFAATALTACGANVDGGDAGDSPSLVNAAEVALEAQPQLAASNPLGELAAAEQGATAGRPWWVNSCGAGRRKAGPQVITPSTSVPEEYQGTKVIVSKQLELTEGGRTDFIEIALEREPQAPVTFSVSVSNDQVTARPAQVTIEPAGWALQRRVLVEPVDDAQLDGDQAFQVVLGVTQSEDPEFNGIDVPDVDGVIRDNEDGEYSVVDLGLPTHFGVAFDINERGQVAGDYNRADGRRRGFLWQDGSWVDVGDGDDNSYAYGINDHGSVVGGTVSSTTQIDRAFVWRDGALSRLPTLGGVSSAEAINNGGLVVGHSKPPSSEQYPPGHAVAWFDGRIFDLGTLGGRNSGALDVNERGQIVGVSETEVGNSYHAFLYECGRMKQLGSMGGDYSFARSINDFGQVVGFAQIPGLGLRAMFYDRGRMVEIPTGTLWESDAHDINNRGQIVGYMLDIVFSQGFLFSNNRVELLKDLVPSHDCWTQLTAQSINDQGDMAGSGQRCSDGAWRPIVITKEPERFQ